MAKKENPIITHTEIISRAISSIKGDIERWRDQCEALPMLWDQREEMFTKSTEELRAKLEALKTLYRIETGTDW